MPPTESTLWRDAVLVYNTMKADSKRVKVDGVNCSLWEGFATHLFSELAIPVPYYGKVLKALKEMGCIRLIRKGARNTPSQWALYKKPVEKDFQAIKDLLATKRRTDILGLEQQVTQLTANLAGIDIKKAFADQEKEMQKLRARVAKLEKGKKAS